MQADFSTCYYVFLAFERSAPNRWTKKCSVIQHGDATVTNLSSVHVHFRMHFRIASFRRLNLRSKVKDQGHPRATSASPEFLPFGHDESRSSEIASSMNSDLADQLSAMELVTEQPHTEHQACINQPLDIELPMPPKLRVKPNWRSIGHAYENESAFVQDLERWNAERAARALLMQEREKK